jgi:ferredoxin
MEMHPVLELANKSHFPLIAMNPLGGGIIPKNDIFFSYARDSDNESIVQAALRFVLSHSSVRSALLGATSLDELTEGLNSVNGVDLKFDAERISRVNSNIRNLSGFCTGCDYCSGCPAGINIIAFMQSRNALLFKSFNAYNRNNPSLLQNIQLFKKLDQDFSIILENAENPCLRCGNCEIKCTQKLSIVDAIADVYQRADIVCFTQTARKKRLSKLLNDMHYDRVGFYPGAGYTAKVLQIYEEFFGVPEFEIFLFDSNPAIWGTNGAYGCIIRPPSDISKIVPDVVIISNYNFSDEIAAGLLEYEQQGITVIKLHDETDVPWVY